MKHLFILVVVFTVSLITGCGGGSSSSGGAVATTAPGQNLPAEFVGVYRGTLNLRAEAGGLSDSDSFAITITVFEDGTIRFDGDEPDETFTAGVTDAGDFAGNININESDCSGMLAVTGQVDGSTASGTVMGEGTCNFDGINLDVQLSGDFNAIKQ